MALDTAAKRLAAISIGSPWRPVVPVPDGTIGQGDRQTLLRLAASVLASAAVALVPLLSRLLRVPASRRALTVPAARRSLTT